MRTETFSYLPPCSDDEIKAQVKFVIDNGWIPGIEYTEEPGPENSYWFFWKLPFFEAKDASEVLDELHKCRQQNPKAYIKITGYDNIRQGQVLAFVAVKPDA